jgi:peptidoglycan/xylan/chitin deacetylase (PgdA/CDA1 family)
VIRVTMDRLLRLLGMLLYLLGLHRLVIWLRRDVPRVLLYHACLPEEGDAIRGLESNTTPGVLARQIDFLLRHYNPITLSALESGPLPPRAVLMTFDDGYRSVYDHAFPLLSARGVPAVVYLISDVVGTGRLVWVNELNWALRRHGPIARPLAAATLGCSADESAEAMVALAVARYDRSRIDALLHEIRSHLPDGAEWPDRIYLDWDEVRAMRAAGIAFGNHTTTHPNLGRLSAAAQRDEMSAAYARIGEMLEPPTSLAYPFGLHDASSAETAFATGHRSVMLVGGGGVAPNRVVVDRTPVRGLSDAEFFAEMEIVAPARARLKRLFRRGAPPPHPRAE